MENGAGEGGGDGGLRGDAAATGAAVASIEAGVDEAHESLEEIGIDASSSSSTSETEMASPLLFAHGRSDDESEVYLGRLLLFLDENKVEHRLSAPANKAQSLLS